VHEQAVTKVREAQRIPNKAPAVIQTLTSATDDDDSADERLASRKAQEARRTSNKASTAVRTDEDSSAAEKSLAIVTPAGRRPAEKTPVITNAIVTVSTLTDDDSSAVEAANPRASLAKVSTGRAAVSTLESMSDSSAMEHSPSRPCHVHR
jgi:hypothetical protein